MHAVPSSNGAFDIFFLLTWFCRMEKPGDEPFYRAGHEEKIGIVMACSLVIDMTRDRDSNDMFARDLVNKRSIEPCVKMPFDGDSNDMFKFFMGL